MVVSGQRDARAAADRYARVRAATVALIAGLDPEDCNLQPEPDVSPAKWHLAHTTWFFETFVLAPFMAGFVPYDARYAYCFNSYYEACGPRWTRARRGDLSRPTLREVLAWREATDDAVASLLAALPDEQVSEVLGRIELGVQHEQQHQELLVMDVLASFAAQPMRPAWRSDPLPAAPPAPESAWVHVAPASPEIGAAGPGFAFDHERPRHPVLLAPFEVASTLVTNEAWRAFVADGGYRTPTLWLSDGWAWVQREGVEAPRYWVADGFGGYGQMTVRGVVALEGAAPVVHVSGFEAEAFATWAGARLPTEAELEVVLAAQGAPEPGDTFLDDGAWTPRPARPGAGVRQAFGDVWTWTRSAFLPYPGFRPLPGALGEYNGKFMNGQWVLRGGSALTPRDHVRPSYRNFFFPHQRWVAAGVRLARDA